MANYFLCMCLLRIALPICLTLSIIFRPSMLSAMYLLLLFYLPIVPVPTTRTMAGHTGCYLKIVICISFLTAVSQLAFQIVLLSLQPYAHIFEDCDFLERILRHVGFVRLNHLSATDVIQWLSPEIIMLFSSIGIYVGCAKLAATRTETPSATEEGEVPVEKPKKRKFGFVVIVGRYVVLASLCIGACLRPSVQGGFYFLIFLGAATWWACYKELRKAFAIVCRIVMVVLFFHISVLYAYQFQWPQEMVEFNSTYSRYFGLTRIMSVDCSDPRSITFNDLEWTSYLNPIWLLWLYYILGLESKLLLMPQVKTEAQKKPGTFSRLDGSFNGPLRRQLSQRLSNRRLVRAGTTHQRWQSATRKVRLIRGVSPSRKYGSGHSKSGSILQDSTGSVTITADGQDEIPMQPLEEELQSSLLENIVYGVASLFQVLMRSSYIATNITMMVWSITYNSYLTFVLLLWANLFWLLPNQRRAMWYSAPVLVVYAELLLIAQYIFSMDLTEDELPTTVNGVELKEIGFEKTLVLPIKPLLAKVLFTTIFWITLRQFMHERQESRQTSALADMVQVTVGTATQAIDKEQASKGSKMMKIFGDYLKQILTKFWIWVVAINLFIVAITGERMTAFRIIYMFLFLIFILTLQLSFRVWRKVMYGFWFLVIGYSMVTLVLVYTYQFESFPGYWTKYLHIPEEQQLDIGLETYDTKLRFVRLLTPTFFVVITVIQVHYFHKEFLTITKIRTRSSTDPPETDPRSEASSAQGGPWDPDSEKTDTDTMPRPRLNLRGLRKKGKLVAITAYLNYKLQQYLAYMWLFLELHMLKIVLLIAMLLTVYDVCAIHFAILLLSVIATTLGRKFQTVAIHLCSIIVSVMLLVRMIYQIKYIDHSTWNVYCSNSPITNTTTNETDFNNAVWLGFRKIDGARLPSLVKWYIGFILVVTLRAIILIRQRIARIEEGLPTSRPFFMFPKITRADAEKNVKSCLKYLVNYGFYKFGVEICLMATVALIGTRMDFYAMLYGFWLCAMFMMSRKKLATVWKWYLAFIAIVLCLQYFMVVGLPPGLCDFFPWDEPDADVLQRMQDWMFLLGMSKAPSARKLICDIVVLILVARQAVVFRIEQRYDGEETEYPGGSNKSIIHLAEEPRFVNPLPDFITYVRTWLDIFKRGVLSSFMWITLAIVFLAGTNRVNLFSLGYLAGSFIFLWQGSDLYLRPIPKILKPWNWLLGYNVFVIIVKTILQIPGCIFINDISECWLLRLLGIGCIKKFGGSALIAGLGDQCPPVPREDIGLAWDGLCFGFLIMQRRIFNSFNFFHIIDEAKATTILASRGADLIEELREKQMSQKGDQERRILEKIKLKMDKIKANQQKIQGPSFKDPTSHFVAIRSGDYYMFDDLDDDELDLITEKDDLVDDELSDAGESRMTVGEERGSPRRSERGTTMQVTIHDVVRIEETDEPVPGSSKQQLEEEMSLLSDLAPREETTVRKTLNVLMFIWAFLESLMNTLTNYLNKFSRDYRYVLRVLSKEKKLLKERTDFRLGNRRGSTQLWEPAGSFQSLVKRTRSTETQDGDTVDLEQQPSSLDPIIQRKRSIDQAYAAEYDSQSPVDIMVDYETAEMSSVDQPPVVRLMHAIWFAILSHSDVVCYFIIFLNQMKSASIISLPLPLMVFLWGTLTVPRPSKTFWITVIAYTEVIVLIKCVFQFKILDDVPGVANNPFHPPRIIGIERTNNYATYDLVLLLVVFFHRLMLKTLGLWKTSYEPQYTIEDGIYKIDDEDDSGDLSNRIKMDDSPKTLKLPLHGETLKEVPETDTDPDSGDHPDSDKSHIRLSSAAVTPFDHMPGTLKMAGKKYTDSVKTFFEHLLDPTSRITADVYAYMFMCDFFNFMVVIFGFAAFGTQQGDGGVSAYLQENKVPIPFLLMLILQFVLIIVDRALFLRKYILGKIVFQFMQIVGVHIWMFFVLPAVTERSFNARLPPQMWYMVKCFYLLLSAYQIRCGYPTRILGNFLCKGYNYVNMFLYKGFMAIPFLFELRTIMDWMWTDTSMTIFDWLKMEDIFAHIFQLKCSRHVETEYPQPRGEKKKVLVKYIMGGAGLFAIIAVLWFPLVFFALGNTVGEANLPYDVTINVRIGPYQPIYSMSAQSNAIYSFSETEYNIMKHNFNRKNRVAQTFLSSYEHEDVATVKLNGNSTMVWAISPPDMERMLEEVSSENPLKIRLQYIISRVSNNKQESGIISSEIQKTMEAKINGKPNPRRKMLYDMLSGKQNVTPILIERIFPKFVKVTNRAIATPVTQLLDQGQNDEQNSMRNITMKLSRSEATVNVSSQMWWELKEDCTDPNYLSIISKLPNATCSYLVMYTFNEKTFPASLSFLSGGGIIGLYTTLVFVASRMIRGFFSEICFKIMFDDMPNVDRILQLCLDIYLVREARELCLEEDLFAKLVFLFRSPETLIKWTRPKEDDENDGDDPDDEPQAALAH